MAEAPLIDAKEDKTDVTIVVVGRSKAGKSTLLNNVFGLKREEVVLSETPGTTKLDTYDETRNGITLHIVDTIGLAQDKKKKKQQLKNLSTYTENKADLVLFCIPVGPNTRFENNNPKLMRALQQCYGQNIWRHCLVVFTFSNHAWDRVKRKEAAEFEARRKYTDYITSYTACFREELIKMGVEEKITSSVECIFDVDKAQPRPTIVTIPAGYDDEDPILPGIELDENEKWIGKLFTEMLESAEKKSKRALLEFRYTREVVKQAFRHAAKKVTQTFEDARVARTLEVARVTRTLEDARVTRTLEDARVTRTLEVARVTRTLEDAIKHLKETFTPDPSQQQPPQTAAERGTTDKSTSRTEKPSTKYKLQRPINTQAPRTAIATARTTKFPPRPTHLEVKEFLQDLDSKEIKKVGVNLGLSYLKLKSIAEENTQDEVIHRWLREDDDVNKTSGHPSWQSLVTALEKDGYNGVAAKVRKGMQENIIW